MSLTATGLHMAGLRFIREPFLKLNKNDYGITFMGKIVIVEASSFKITELVTFLQENELEEKERWVVVVGEVFVVWIMDLGLATAMDQEMQHHSLPQTAQLLSMR